MQAQASYGFLDFLTKPFVMIGAVLLAVAAWVLPQIGLDPNEKRVSYPLVVMVDEISRTNCYGSKGKNCHALVFEGSPTCGKRFIIPQEALEKIKNANIVKKEVHIEYMILGWGNKVITKISTKNKNILYNGDNTSNEIDRYSMGLKGMALAFIFFVGFIFYKYSYDTE